ncbi:MAG: DUF4835 family protein [Bacteroidia bacterium]
MRFFQKYLILLLCYISCSVFSQELNCQVQVVSQQVQGTDAKRIFDNMQKQIFEFMNNTKWTKDIYTTSERIDCTILINVTEKVSTTDFKATIQVQCRRPVFKSSYNSPLFNYNDQNFEFSYVEFQPFDFNTTTYSSNLTSVLGYYAYVILAFDYDSFSPLGGTEYWQKAQQITTNAQNGSNAGPGWKAFEGNKNRYWLVENILNPVFTPIRETCYKYHRLGLDIMVDKPDDGRAIVLESIIKLKEVHKNRPSSYNMQLFFNAKADEIINIFSGATPAEKQTATETLNLIDAANINKYAKILGTN